MEECVYRFCCSVPCQVSVLPVFPRSGSWQRLFVRCVMVCSPYDRCVKMCPVKLLMMLLMMMMLMMMMMLLMMMLMMMTMMMLLLMMMMMMMMMSLMMRMIMTMMNDDE